MRFDSTSIDLFIAVAEAGSLSVGAQRQNLALAAASRRIAALEAQVALDLFTRHAQGVRLTPAGQVFLDHCRVIRHTVTRLQSDLADFTRGTHGRVRIAANASTILQFLPADIRRLQSAHPALQVELVELSSDQVARAVGEGTADIGFFQDGTPSDGLVIRAYRRDRLVIVVPAGHEIAALPEVKFTSLLDHDFIGLHHGAALLNRMYQALDDGVARRPRLRLQVHSFDAVCRMVKAGVGLGLLPDGAVEPHLRSMDLRAVPITEPWAQRQHYVAVRRDADITPPVRATLDVLLTSQDAKARLSE